MATTAGSVSSQATPGGSEWSHARDDETEPANDRRTRSARERETAAGKQPAMVEQRGSLVNTIPSLVCLSFSGVYMLPLRGYTPMRYLRSPAVADPTDSTPRSQVDHARQHTTEVDPVRAASFTRPLYDGASSPSEVSFLERLMNHSDHGGVDSQSGSVSAQHPQPAFSLVSPIMRLYVPHALERYRPRRRRRGRIDPFSLVRGVAAWMRAQHGFFSFRLGEAAELDAQGVTVDDRFDRVHFYYSMIDMCRCIHCAIEAGFKPRRIFHFARSVHLGPREEAELFYFMPITLRGRRKRGAGRSAEAGGGPSLAATASHPRPLSMCHLPSPSTEVGLLCSDRLIRNGSVLYSNLSLALDDCASFQQPCDSFSATTEVLVCRVSLQPGRTFILAAHDLQPRHYTHSLSLAHPHAVLVFDTACVLPMWFLTVDESAVYGGTPVAQMTRDAAPDGTVTPATPTTTVRQLNVKAVAMQLAIQLRTPNATRPNTETLARAPNAMRRA